MINSITEFARCIYEKRLEEIEKYLQFISHPGTRGDMFEGLTQEIINETLCKVPEIHVCEGFIKNYRTGVISPQSDAILFFGDCETIPGTNHKIVAIDNVIAFIEVKKTLEKKELHDFYEKQGKIYDLVDDEVKFDGELFSYACKALFGMNELNDEKSRDLPKLGYYLYHIIKTENAEPLRICLGYEGFKKEGTLRDNLIYVIQERAQNGLPHTGMNSLPSLVICENNCLVKSIGYPSICSYNDPYPIMQSLHGDTLKVLLKMLMCKIESKIGACFSYEDDDFAQYEMNYYLWATIDEQNNDVTKFFVDSSPIPKKTSEEKEWLPTILTDYEYVVACKLCEISNVRNPYISLNDPIFEGHDLSKDLNNLIQNRFVSIHDNIVELVSVSCQLAICCGEFMIGENNSGQMMSWILRNRNKESMIE